MLGVDRDFDFAEGEYMNASHLLGGLVLAAVAACAGWSAPSTPIPDALVPAEQTQSERAAARGVQIYECRATADTPPKLQWVFVAPQADLFDRDGKQIGTHYAGPTWQSSDGSKIVGSVKARADAPRAGAIPWLLLTTAPAGSSGRVSKVAYVQRINTVGGAAPETPCDASTPGTSARVPYTADYVFLSP